MNWEFDKNLKIPDIDNGPDGRPIVIVREVPIYKIPLNKKGFCKPTVSIETKDGPKVIQRCQYAGSEKTCARCVINAKKLYKNSRGGKK